MLTINIGSQTFTIPQSWSELIGTGRYLQVMAILAAHPDASDDITIRYAIYEKVMLLYADGALEVTEIPQQLIPAAASMLIEQVYPAMVFIFDTYCIECPMPSIRHRGFTYIGKTDRMLPMTGSEMEDCAYRYAEYQKTGDIRLLDQIIDILYRPRIPLIRYIHRSGLSGISDLEKLGIKWWYESCEAWWFSQYRRLYESAGASTATRDSLTVSRLIRGLAGPKRGIVEQVRKMDRSEIYFELAELDREREEAEDKS